MPCPDAELKRASTGFPELVADCSTAVMRRLGMPGTVHGWRSTFRDWTAERTATPSEVAEMALAHAIGDKTEAAYRRGDLFDKRRELMNAWADFLGGTGKESPK